MTKQAEDHRLRDGVDYIHIENLQNDVVCGFFGAAGGVSTGIYEGLNCSYGSNDDMQAVTENRRRVAAALNLSPEKVLSLKQVHGVVCADAAVLWENACAPEADTMVTDVPGTGLGVLTADCAPVLFRARKKHNDAPVIGAAHAGWRGAFGGVLESTMQAMEEKGADLSSLQVIVGPCLQRQSYEVDESFRDQFIKQDVQNSDFFKAAELEGKFMFDLSGYIVGRLSGAGVSNVIVIDHDTFTAEDRYFSYRRNTKAGLKDYGRQISVIAIKGT